MDRIVLEGMTFFAKHGYYDEEQILGNTFIVDVYANTDLESVAFEDNLLSAINYEQVYLIVRHEMRKPARLLENVGHRIAQQVKSKAGGYISSVDVTIRKCNPPLGGRVKYSIVETSGRIGLEGMAFFAPVGSKEDRIVANEFLATVFVETSIAKASKSDNLNDTLNYESIFWATKTEIQEPASLLENVAYRIADNLKSKHRNIKKIEVQLSKKNPPLRGQIPEASIEMHFDHQSSCTRCNRSMLCYLDDNCWCNDYRILSATQRMIDLKYGGCLCKNCSTYYGKKKEE